MPIIPNTKKKNIRKTKVFASSGSDLNMILTSLLNLGIRLTDLSGLITLNARSPLIPVLVYDKPKMWIIISVMLINTTKKSKAFQPFLR